MKFEKFPRILITVLWITSKNIQIGQCLSWESYNGKEILTNITATTRQEANKLCKSHSSVLVAPVSEKLRDAVIASVIKVHPVTTFWTGFTRVADDKWTSTFYNAVNSSLHWKDGNYSTISGDCLVMEVMPWEIRYGIHGCNATQPFICYRSNDANNFQQLEKEKVFPSGDYFTVTHASTEAICAASCSSDVTCKAYSYNATDDSCSLFREIVDVDLDDLIVYADGNAIYNATECCFSNGTVNLNCCYRNNTALDGDCNLEYKGNDTIGSCAEHFFRTFNLTAKIGCLIPDAPLNGIMNVTSIAIGAEFVYSCTWNYGKMPDSNITCGSDYKWSDTPYCKYQAPRCPDGWEQFQGSCYLVDLPGGSKTWEELIDSCAVYNAFPIYLDSAEESNFVDKLLYFHKDLTFWTGISNQLEIGFYQLSHNYKSSIFWNWEVSPFLQQGCVSLQRTSGGVDKQKFYYNTTNCKEEMPYICKMGSATLGQSCSNGGCRGHAACNQGFCGCEQTVRPNMIGSYGNPMSYCSFETKKIDSYEVLNPGLSLPWVAAVSFCKKQGASLLTPVTKDLENLALSSFWKPGYGGTTSWTGLHTSQGQLKWTGFSQYELTEAHRPAWRKIPDLSSVNATDTCVVLEIAEIGTRLFAVEDCTELYNAICIKYNETSKPLTDTDNSALIPAQNFTVKTEQECETECLYLSTCLSFAYHFITKTCYLYETMSAGANSDSYWIRKKISRCSELSVPWNGLLATRYSDIGSINNFSCDPLFKIPPTYSSAITCNNNGRWSQLPDCISEVEMCPNGWEQDGTVCYYLSDKKLSDETKTWSGAVTACNKMDSHLLQLNDDKELLTVSKMLDVNKKKKFWTGGTDKLIESYYTWETSKYTEISYAPFYPGVNGEGAQPEVDLDKNCLSLGRIYNFTDVGSFYLRDDACTQKLRYVCMKRVINIGSTGCAVYGVNSCKLHASCVNDVCTCNTDYFQVGQDAENDTKCISIKPIGSSDCLTYDELCYGNSSICNAWGTCKCPDDMYQNGPDGSHSTTCTSNQSPCPSDDWYWYNAHCYKVMVGVVSGAPDNLKSPEFVCGSHRAHLGIIHSETDNNFFKKMGNSRSTRWIGWYYDSDQKVEYWADGSPVVYNKHAKDNSTTGDCATIDIVGIWRKESCTDFNEKADVICERTTRCNVPLGIANAVDITYDSEDMEVGITLLYSCLPGYVFSGGHSGAITCEEINRQSVWSNLPVCQSLLVEHFSEVSGSLYGTNYNNSTSSDKDLCSDACFHSDVCQAYRLDPSQNICYLYTDVNAVSGPDRILLSVSTKLRNPVCGAVPYSLHTSTNFTGRQPGDTVTYRCKVNYRVNRFKSSTLTCLSNGRWDNKAPECISRFKRTTGIFKKTRDYKLYHKIYSADVCEERCVEERTFRCIQAVFYSGVCYLLSTFMTETRGDYIKSEDGDEAVISELIDSDLEEFDLEYGKKVDDITGSFLKDVSVEVCAQECLFQNCTLFMFETVNATCFLYDETEGQLSISSVNTDLGYRLFKLRYGCYEPPPSVEKSTMKPILQQSKGVYSIGDIVHYSCNIPGEERLNNHSGDVECQKTGYWTSPPVCKNLCEAGWYMMNYTCYKLIDSPTNFWTARNTCLSQNAGLTNLWERKELEILQTIWNWTGSSSQAVWIGLYSDMEIWKWSEELGGNITQIFPGLRRASLNQSVVLVLNNLTTNINFFNDKVAYICEKAAGKLICPMGWVAHFSDCLYVNDTELSYDDAKAACSDMSASLVNVSSVFAAEILAAMLNDHGIENAYVGLHKSAPGMYKFSSGARMEYYYMFTLELYINHEKCGIIKSNKYLDLVTCSSTLPFICQKSLAEIGKPEDFSSLPCSTDEFCNDSKLHCAGSKVANESYFPVCRGKECPHPWTIIGGQCYWFPNKSISMADNSKLCKQKGGYLFVPNTVYEKYRIFYWIRANYESVNLIFLGINNFIGGDLMTADARQYPNGIDGASGECSALNLQLSEMALLKGQKCTSAFHGLCEKSPAGPEDTEYAYEGCYLDSLVPQEKELGMYEWTSGVMTVDLCVNHCRSLDYKYAALTDGSLCDCGNSRGNQMKTLSTNCQTPCFGNSSQFCGGPAAKSVYRTSGDVCTQTMPHSPLDPQVCYSFELAYLNINAGTYDCQLQGGDTVPGDLVSVENPVTEEALYNQLLLNTLRYSVSEIVAFIGIDQPRSTPHKWRSGTEADWLQIVNENAHNYWKFGVVMNMSMNGLWQEKFTFLSKYAYVCQLHDVHRKVKGSIWQRQYTPIASIQTHTEGNFKLGQEYDFGCLLARSICPEGFTLQFWLKLQNSSSVQILLSSGDCVTDLFGSFGFCVFYNPNQQRLVAVDIQKEVVKRMDFPVILNSWTNILMYFDVNSDIFMFINGSFVGKLETCTNIMLKTRVILEDVDLFYEEDAENMTNLRNLTFTAAPPDGILLSAIQALSEETSWFNTSATNSTSQDQSWMHFKPWGMNISSWSGPGVDGNGLKIPYKSFSYHLGEFPIEWATHLVVGDIHFSFSVWIKLAFNIKENSDIIRHGAGTDSDPGILIYFDALSQKLVFSVMYCIQQFEISYSASEGEWYHYGMVFENVMRFYVNGRFLEPMSTSVQNTTDKAIKDATIHSGSGVCPLGWTKFGLSCYYKSQTTGLDFWQQEHHCRALNGHLLVVDTEQESAFVKDFLYDGGQVFMGVYDIQQDTSRVRRWFNTRGYRHHNIHFNDTAAESSESINFVSMEWNPGYIGAFTIASGDFDTGTPTNDSLAANATNLVNTTSSPSTTACEINLTGPQTRIQLSERCSAGWKFWNKNCYKLLNTTLMTSDEAELQCASFRSSLVSILSKEEQAFISNWMLSVKVDTFHIGLRLLQPPSGNATYMWNDLRPLDYTYWYPGVSLKDSQKPCAVANCTGLPCSWYPHQCSAYLKAVCKKPADMKCGVGWRMYKDKCVAMYENMTGVDDSVCTNAGTTPLSLRNTADKDEYLHMFGSESWECLTDGIVNGTNSYIWKSTGTFTYFDGLTISGSGQCIGLSSTATELVRKSCSLFTCVICQHYQNVGIEVDNIQIKMQHQTADKMYETYTKNDIQKAVYTWEMDDMNNGCIKGHLSLQNDSFIELSTVYLTSDAGLEIQVDPTMDRILKVDQAHTGGMYNLTPSDTCLSNLIHCKLGITVMFWFKGFNLSQCVLVDTKTDGTTGLTLWLDDSGSRLFARVTEQNYYWEDWVWLMSQEWVHILVTWQKNTGLKFFTNFQLIHSVMAWQKLSPFVPVVSSSGHLLVGNCTSNSTPYLLMDSLEIHNYEIGRDQVYELCKVKDVKKVLDFNTFQNSSTSNINVNLESGLTYYVWRNSLFYTALHVDNKSGNKTAVHSQQLFHCLTRTDICIGPFTTSLWLRPLDIDSDQIFLYTGTKASSDLDILSMKIWFKYTNGEYLLDLYYDKTHFSKPFYLDPYEWSHVVIVANLPEGKLVVYVNGQESTTVTMTTTFTVNRIQPQNSLTFFNIGQVGRFEIDDIQHIQKQVLPWEFYVLKSCDEYKLAGFRGVQYLYIDTDTLDNQDEAVNVTCMLTDYTPYHFTLDINDTSQVSVLQQCSSNQSVQQFHVPGILGEAAELNKSCLTINLSHVQCFSNIAYCYFGFSFAFWVKLYKVGEPNNEDIYITLFRMGGKNSTNDTGIDIVCYENQKMVESLQCTLSLLNGSVTWSLNFHLQYKHWYHLVITWNQHRGLKLYKNGALLSDLGAVLEITQRSFSVVNITDMSSEIICIGLCGQNHIEAVMVTLDDLYLSEIDWEQHQIRKLYGLQPHCWMDKHWNYLEYTNMCYQFSTTLASYSTAEQTCQSLGGNLAVESDLTCHQQLGTLAQTVGSGTSFTTALRDRVVHNSRTLRWPDGSQPDFTTLTLTIPVSDTTGYCASIDSVLSNTWTWTKRNIATANRFICQNQPWFVMGDTLYLNSTVISPMSAMSSGITWTGNISFVRGETPSSMVFNNTQASLRLSDKCIVNAELCHNGLTIQFWLKSLGVIKANPKQVIMTSMSNESSHGIMIYLHHNGSDVKLTVDIRRSSNFTSTKVPVSLNHWTHVALSLHNDTSLSVFLNGKQVGDKSVSTDLGDTAARAEGEEVTFTIGADWNGMNTASVMLDNMTVHEFQILDSEALYKAVHENFPDFYLPFDDLLLLTLPPSGVTCSPNGWLGNYIEFDGTVFTRFVGQFYQDCFGFPDFCREGFSLSFWLHPVVLDSSQGVLSLTSNDRGIALIYYISYKGLGERFWMFIRDNNQELRIPFKLKLKSWSHIFVAWYVNGTTALLVNGINHDTSVVTSGSVTPAAAVDAKDLTLGSVVGMFPLPYSNFKGGIDDLIFRPRPLNESEMLNIYKNSTFIKKPYSYTFEKQADGMAETCEGVNGNGSFFNSGIHWLNLTSDFNQTNCLLDIDNCVHGFTVSLHLKFLHENDTDQIILTTGAHQADGLGFALMYTAMNKSMPFRRYFGVSVLTSSHEYRTWFNLKWGVWNQIIVTFHKMFGVKVFVDDVLSILQDDGIVRSTPFTNIQQNLVLGEFPATGIGKGMFAIDELVILDRAIFEDSIEYYSNKLWLHQLHSQIEQNACKTSTQFTRDECHDLCENSSCPAYSMCDITTYGTCHTHMANHSDASVFTSVINPSCDTFLAVAISAKVQKFGCFPVSEVVNTFSEMSSLPLINNSSCVEACQNYSKYHYSAVVSDGSQCFCGRDLDYMGLLPSTNVTCDGSSVLLYQLTGLRDFMNVTTSIITFDVDLTPGSDIMVNSRMFVNMTTNNLSFAGYGISLGDSTPVIYTNRNFVNHIYSQIGSYLLEISAMNEISLNKFSQLINVFESISGIEIYAEKVVATNYSVNVTVQGEKGSNVTCTVDFGDESQIISVQRETLVDPIYVSNVYSDAGIWNVSVLCNNSISNATDFTVIQTMHRIINLQLITPYAVVFGDDVNITWLAEKGSNVQVNLTYNSHHVYSSTVLSLNISRTQTISVSQYMNTGKHFVNISTLNVVSNMITISKIVYVDIKIKNLLLNATKYFCKINETVEFIIMIQNGSNIDLRTTFGDGFQHTVQLEGAVSHITQTQSHKYTTDEDFMVTVYANNSVTSLNTSTEIHVEHVVDIISLQIVTVSDPSNPVSFILSTPASIDPHPTNAVFDLQFGDNQTTGLLPLSLNSSGKQQLQHTYLTNGYFRVVMYLHNNVSSKVFTNMIQVGSAVEDLRVETLSAVPLGSTSYINVDISAGSFVMYTVNFGDGSPTVSSASPMTYPNTVFTVNHTYLEIAKYPINVTAANSFGTVVNSSITISVMEEITGLIVESDRKVTKVDWANVFYVQFLTEGTDTCIHFNAGDGTQYLFGESICTHKDKYAGLTYQYLPPGSTMAFSHMYTMPGDFTVVVEASNEVSVDMQSFSMKILDFPCVFPKVSIYGFSENASDPTYSYPSSENIVRAIADTFCIPIRNVIFQWSVIRTDREVFDNTTFSLNSLPYLTIPANVLKYGLYKISVLIFIENFSVFNDTSVVYLYLQPSPLTVEITGGYQRSTRLGYDVILDSSHSFDPDYGVHGEPYTINWYCWISPVEFDVDIDINSPNLKPVGTDSCHSRASGGQNRVSILHASDFTLAEDKTYVAKMSVGSRSVWTSQKVAVIEGVWPQLSVECKENCGAIIAVSLPVKLKGVCQSCTWYNRLQLDYTWKLYEVVGSVSTEVIDWQHWTDTGTKQINLVIQPDRLTAGTTYDLRLQSGEAFAVKRLHVSLPPYNGSCQSNTKVGRALSTKFIISCSNWLDEGSQKTRNVLTDKQYPSIFEFTFHYGRTNHDGHYEVMPFFQVVGLSAKAPEMILCSGAPADDNRVDIIVHVRDYFGSVAISHFEIKVLESRKSPEDILKGDDMRQCKAEQDMMCMLMLSRGIAEITNQLMKQKTASESTKAMGVVVMEEVVQLMVDHEDLVQDEVLARSTVDTLLMVQESTEHLSTNTKIQIIGLYRNLVRSLENSIKVTMTSTEKQYLATSLLSGVIDFCQTIKYDQSCSADCENAKTLGNSAIDLMSITDNITRLLLETTVPEEKAIAVNISHGSAVIFVQRKDILNVMNSTLQVEGYPVADIPDLFSVIDVTNNQHLDIQILVSDILQTTDASSKYVKTRTTLLSFMNSSGSVMHLQNLMEPLMIRMYPQLAQNLDITTVNLSATNMFYMEIKLNESGIIPFMVFHFQKSDTGVRFLVKLGTMPTEDSYDMEGVLSSKNFSSEAITDRYILRLTDQQLQDRIQNSTSPAALHVGLRAANHNETIESVDIGVLAVDCYYWQEEDRQWTKKGLSLGTFQSLDTVLCKSTHLSTFGVNIFVPPNTINFKTVWSQFSADNLAVTCTVATVLGLYFFILVFVRRADKKDIQKWAIYPLIDNLSSDVYHYHMTVYTGMRSGAGTTSKVFFVIGGEDGDTEIRALRDHVQRPLSRSSVNNYLLSVPYPLGNLLFMRIWHDSSGKGADGDWLLNMVVVKDAQTKERYVFLCDQWLSVEKDDRQVERLLPVAGSNELQTFDHMFYNQTRKDLTDGHLWISVLSRPIHSIFTRVQRLSCCLSLLFLTMVTDAMWYGTVENTNQQDVHLGPFTFSAQEFITSLLASVVVVPVSLLIITLFKKSERRKPKEDNKQEEKLLMAQNSLSLLKNEICQNETSPRCVTPSAVEMTMSQNKAMYATYSFQENDQICEQSQPATVRLKEKSTKKKKFKFPYWCLYVAWGLVALSVLAAGFFTVLYSMEWGSEKSSKWLIAFLLSFIESVLLVQPLKVIVVAVVLILIFRSVDDDDDDDSSEVLLPEVDLSVEDMIKNIEHRQPYQARHTNLTEIEDLRIYRKRCQRLFHICQQLGAYIVYLVVIAVLTYENRNKNAYNTYYNMENIFLKPQNQHTSSFVNISSPEIFWEWSHDVLVPNLYSEGWYGNSVFYDGYLTDHVHYRVGTPRLRQVRIRQDVCSVPEKFKTHFPICYPEYQYKTNDDQDYSEGWVPLSHNSTSSPWKYQSVLNLNGYPVVGTYGSYGGGGYVASLGSTNISALSMFEYLKESRWIDRKTRAVIVEANIYNPNINMFCVLSLVLEFPPTGSIIPYSQISPVSLYRYVGASAIFLLVVDLCFVAFTIYYLVGLIHKIRDNRWSFFKEFWNCIDFLNMMLSIAACALYGVHFLAAKLVISDFQRNKDAFLNLQNVVFWEGNFGYAVAFLLFFAMLKLLLLIRFNPKITQLSGTLKKAFGPMSSFFVVFLFVFVAFAHLGYLVFGKDNREYSNMVVTFETLMSMLMMKMNIDNMLEVNRVLGMLYLFLFALFIVFILVNILLSIINDAFTDVREDPTCLPDDPAMAQFLFDQIKNLILGYISKKAENTVKKGHQENATIDMKIEKMESRINRYLTLLKNDNL